VQLLPYRRTPSRVLNIRLASEKERFRLPFISSMISASRWSRSKVHLGSLQTWRDQAE
jgi:hypothetical protein